MGSIAKFLLRYLYVVVGWFILIPVVCYSEYNRHKILPKLFYCYDNEEEGYYGNKAKKEYRGYKGFWEHYLGIDYESSSFLTRWWYSYKWCAWRNPAWNLRYNKWVSVDNTKGILIHEGNTVYHDFRQVPDASLAWYNCVTIIDGVRHKSRFRLIRLFKGYALYLRWGWKIYPEYRKLNKPVPIYKDRSILAITLRVRKY